VRDCRLASWNIARIEDTITTSPLPGSTTNEKVRGALAAARLANQHRKVLEADIAACFDHNFAKERT
jgi:hypothetical protein